jgi:ribonucleoside-diphosphate reductase alpha chain
MVDRNRAQTTADGVNGHPPNLGREIILSDNARTVLARRYLIKDETGQPAETIEEMFWRVASHVAAVEGEMGGDAQAVAEQFYDLLTARRFFPNSPTFTGAGTPLGQLAACFVLQIDDDMGRSESGIFQTLRNAALIQQTGGGNGFSFSRLRPKGASVHSSGGQATGPVGFLRVYDQAFGEVAQGGSRRGANMAVLRVDHPDIREFITCKTDENQITNFNISVALTDAFMEAVRRDEDFDLVNPQDDTVWETVRARELFDLIVKQAHHNGEPGVLFIDAANRANPNPHLGELEATNPCGEQFLSAFENCCLGSINLAQHVTDDGQVDWERLQESIELSTRFLDDVVSANAYVPAVPQLKEAAHRVRRIGLGIMGLGDLMYRLSIRYGSEEAQEFAGQVMEFVRHHSLRTSIELAKERGPFTAIEGSIYDPNDLKWEPPRPVFRYSRNWGRPALDWSAITKGIKQHGIRNGAQTTIAPTGTIATVAGCEGYGCEPVFALAYTRHFNDNGRDVELPYTSPLFEKSLVEAGLSEAERQAIIEQAMLAGSCQDVDGAPEHIRHTFVVSADIQPEEHVRMQAAMQAFVDNSISKTCNFPSGAAPGDVAEAYMTAWELGCKGLTVYVTGSREKVVLETAETVQAKSEQVSLFGEPKKKPRPTSLAGTTHRLGTPAGTAYVTVNRNGDDEPFEVFIQTAKAGSETNAVSEALGRLISYILRLASPVRQTDRLKEVVRQLDGIGGGRPLGLGPNRVLSLPDGVARALAIDLGNVPEDDEEKSEANPGQMVLFKIGDLCPECGEAAFVKEEGCRHCYACGFSEC